MADNLKSFFGKRVVEELAQDFSRAQAGFDAGCFTSECLDGLDRLELLARGWHIAEAMRRHLPQEFPQAAGVLLRSLDGGRDVSEARAMEVFRYLPHVFYVSRYGLGHFEEAMQLQRELTKRFTAEYSIRPFLERYPNETYARLKEWALDPDVHVRRLVSEGTRPRLPWAPRLREFQRDPAPVVALLELLKDDPELYVRRSVANNLNDIGKDHPEVLVEVCRRWLVDASAERKWIVRHALRSLVKKGYPGALELMGAGTAAKVRVEGVRFAPKRVRIGERVSFELELVSTGKKAQSLLIDYAVDFVKANGKTAKKVFKLKRVELGRGERVELRGSVSFREMTTRKPYPGVHRLELLVNGAAMELGQVRVIA